jgi:polyphosphate kinase
LRWIRDYFLREVMPVLTPIGLDPAHPFPRVLNKSLNFAVELEGRDAFGRTRRHRHRAGTARPAPRHPVAGRSCAAAIHGFVFLSPRCCTPSSNELFPGMTVLGCYQFRVTRNSDLFVDEEEVKDLRTALQGELPQRHFGDAVRLEVADSLLGNHGRLPADSSSTW